jgi:hypothetical protein
VEVRFSRKCGCAEEKLPNGLLVLTASLACESPCRATTTALIRYPEICSRWLVAGGKRYEPRKMHCSVVACVQGPRL